MTFAHPFLYLNNDYLACYSPKHELSQNMHIQCANSGFLPLIMAPKQIVFLLDGFYDWNPMLAP